VGQENRGERLAVQRSSPSGVVVSGRHRAPIMAIGWHKAMGVWSQTDNPAKPARRARYWLAGGGET